MVFLGVKHTSQVRGLSVPCRVPARSRTMPTFAHRVRKPGMSARYQILISNEQSAVAISEDELRRVATLTLQSEGVVSAEISLAVVDDPAIHKVNRNYLQHDYPTDVISFLLDSGTSDPPTALPIDAQSRRGAGQWLHGDVILSADTAQREAAEYGWEPQSEICLYLVHGLLHLCGYDDLTDEEQTVMRSREREILHELGMTPRYEEDEPGGRPPQSGASVT
jgi:probable rRNA maturation factor